jgi:hypothetical protein
MQVGMALSPNSLARRKPGAEFDAQYCATLGSRVVWRLAPSGGVERQAEWSGQVVRFARLISTARPRLGPAFGRRRLRRQSHSPRLLRRVVWQARRTA